MRNGVGISCRIEWCHSDYSTEMINSYKVFFINIDHEDLGSIRLPLISRKIDLTSKNNGKTRFRF